MANERLKAVPITAYLKKEDYNIFKFYCLEKQVSQSKCIYDAILTLINLDGNKIEYPLGGFKNDTSKKD